MHDLNMGQRPQNLQPHIRTKGSGLEDINARVSSRHLSLLVSSVTENFR